MNPVDSIQERIPVFVGQNPVKTYNEKLLEEALTANESRKDFDGARVVINIYKAERINHGR